jgi:hypothetical protein
LPVKISERLFAMIRFCGPRTAPAAKVISADFLPPIWAKSPEVGV